MCQARLTASLEGVTTSGDAEIPEGKMYLMSPASALDLARYRVEQDLARAEAHRAARELKEARKAQRLATSAPRHRRRFAAARGVARMRLGH